MSPDGQRGQRLTSTHRLPTLHVLVGDASGRAAAPGLARWLVRVAPARARGTVSLAIVSDYRVRALNRQYLRRDYATDVLSFPASARPRDLRASAKQTGAPEPAPRASSGPFLGDIAIARGVAKRQARIAGHSERTELRVLALHGLLHLLGYDHERDRGEMRRVEKRLRRKGGLREGLIERGGPVRRR
jgi:probable rRNA maturation factor